MMHNLGNLGSIPTSLTAAARWCRMTQNFYGYVGATAAFNTVYAMGSTANGFSVGWSAGLSPQMGFPISTNFLSMGANYNISHDDLSGNLSAWGVDKNGWTFSPSVSAMFLEEQATNLVRGQGFRSKDQILSRFVANGQYQRALDYFGFKGTYDPNNPMFKEASANADAITNPYNGDIFYRESSFKNYDYLYSVADHEWIHHLQVAKSGVTANDIIYNEREWEAYMHNYKNQGLYLNYGSQNDLITNIKYFGLNAEKYHTFDNPNLAFTPKWWYFIYRIPRKW